MKEANDLINRYIYSYKRKRIRIKKTGAASLTLRRSG